jgi:erythromycin esterase-like protein
VGFWFGEATHGTKEFFDLKAKFFKYIAKIRA